MPVGPYIPGLIKITHFYTGDRDSSINVQYCAASEIGAYTTTQLNALALELFDLWKVAWPPFMTSNQYYAGDIVVDQGSDTGLEGIAPDEQVGGGSSEVVPAQVAAVCTWETPLRYRGGHPRNYLPGPSASLFGSNQSLTSGAITDIEAALATYIAGVNAISFASGGLSFVALHARMIEDKGPPIVYKEPTLQAISAGSVRATFGTQRKRVERVSRRA